MLPLYELCTALAWKSDSKTIKGAEKRGMKRENKKAQNLVYFLLKLSRLHSGIKCPGRRSSGKSKTRYFQKIYKIPLKVKT